MEDLETQVREALIEKKTDELVKYASEDPTYASDMLDIAGIMADEMIKAILGAFPEEDDKELEELKKEYHETVLPQIKAQMSDPAELRKTMRESAENHYLPLNKFKEKIRLQFIGLDKDDEIGDDVKKQYEASFEELYRAIETQEQIVRKLVKIAETHGVKKATEDQSIYRTIREVIPTAEEYRKRSEDGVNIMNDIFSKAQNALMADGELGQAIAGAFGAVRIAMEKAVEMKQGLQKRFLEDSIKKIYG